VGKVLNLIPLGREKVVECTEFRAVEVFFYENTNFALLGLADIA
jgi:hypothetical protein